MIVINDKVNKILNAKLYEYNKYSWLPISIISRKALAIALIKIYVLSTIDNADNFLYNQYIKNKRNSILFILRGVWSLKVKQENSLIHTIKQWVK